MPASIPSDRGRVEQAPVLVAHRRRQLHDHPDDRADADAEQQRRQARVEGGGADPGAEDRRGAGDQAEAEQAPEARRRRRLAVAVAVAQRRHDRQALGGVVDREADDEEGAQGERPARVGGADRQALAEVVEADPDRHQQRQVGAAGARRRRRLRRAALAAREVGVDPGQGQVGDEGADEDEAGAAEGGRRLGGDLQPLEPGVDREEGEQADGEGDQGAIQRRAEAAAGRAARASPG